MLTNLELYYLLVIKCGGFQFIPQPNSGDGFYYAKLNGHKGGDNEIIILDFPSGRTVTQKT